MSEQSGLSIFDAAKNSAEATFPLARRGGYDSDAVDAWVRNQASELSGAADRVKSLENEVSELRETVSQFKERADSVDKPSYTTLGGHAAQLLQLAEREAEDVRTRAAREAEEFVKKAEEEASLLRTAAAKDAEELRTRAVTELEDKRRSLLEEAEAKKAEATAYSEDLRAQVEREASQVRLAAEQDVQNMRLGASREVEQARAAADREVTEARRVLAVEKERLAREASDNHVAASEQTAKLVGDAETRAAAADERARDLMSQATKSRDSASAEAARIVDSAKTEASAIVSNAHAEADHLRATATTSVERETRNLRAEVEDLERKREGILSQMGQLRDIVASFAPSTVLEDKGDDKAAANRTDKKKTTKDAVEEKPVARTAEKPAPAETTAVLEPVDDKDDVSAKPSSND
ncbi:DivIVA domain-containing protein [Aeromicrobium sp.]|uniref:DivIVA domain-containing protein n=1 Tax=Aeromicrobium sp. TaxID=1871063 RepID=UPI003D6B7AF1